MSHEETIFKPERTIFHVLLHYGKIKALGETFSIMTSMLSDIEKLVIETIRMRLTTQQALKYLRDNEFPVSRATYFRHKRRVEGKKLERVYHIAKLGFVDQRFQSIDGLEIIEKKMGQEYNREYPFKRIQILKDFIKNGMYISK